MGLSVASSASPNSLQKVDAFLVADKGTRLEFDGLDAIETFVAALRDKGFSWVYGHLPSDLCLLPHSDGDEVCDNAAPTVHFIHRSTTLSGNRTAVYFQTNGEGCEVRVTKGEWTHSNNPELQWRGIPEGNVCVMVQYQIKQS